MTTTPTQVPQASGNLAAKLEALRQRTDATIRKASQPSKLADSLHELTQQTLEAAGTASESERAAKMKIIHARFTDVKQTKAQEEADLADLVLNLQDLSAQLGAEYVSLHEPTAAETARIAHAEAALKQAEVNATKTGFLSVFSKASRAEALEKAKAGLEETKRAVQRDMRARLKAARTEESMQQIITMNTRIRDITEERKATTEKEMAGSKLIREKAQTDVVTYSAESDALASLKAEAQQTVAAQELKLKDTQQGTEAFATEDQKLSELKAAQADIEGRHNVTLARIRFTQVFVKEHSQEEETLRKQRTAQEILTESLRIQIENQGQTVKAMVELERGYSDIEIGASLTSASVEASRRQMNRAAQIGAAIQNEIAEAVEGMPAKLRQLEVIREADAEANSTFRKRMQKAIDDLKVELPQAAA
ncbi:MAG TPA: hypothetical protein VJJ47_01535 [Candidatus Paceibacterota bacterium]